MSKKKHSWLTRKLLRNVFDTVTSTLTYEPTILEVGNPDYWTTRCIETLLTGRKEAKYNTTSIFLAFKYLLLAVAYLTKETLLKTPPIIKVKAAKPVEAKVGKETGNTDK